MPTLLVDDLVVHAGRRRRHGVDRPHRELEPAERTRSIRSARFGEDALARSTSATTPTARSTASSPRRFSDCNGNALADACDNRERTSQDGNSNGRARRVASAPSAPPAFVYCSAKLNSTLCLPAIAYSGLPKLTYTTPFVISATHIVNNKQGLLFYGHGSARNDLPRRIHVRATSGQAHTVPELGRHRRNQRPARARSRST